MDVFARLYETNAWLNHNSTNKNTYTPDYDVVDKIMQEHGSEIS